MKKIGLVVDSGKKEAVKLAQEVQSWLEKKTYFASIKPLSSCFSPSPFLNVNLVITLGGDGMVLEIANILASFSNKIPMARVNFGTRGYLCNIKPDEVFQYLEKILDKQFYLEDRTRVEAEIFKGKTSVCSFDAFNEIVVGITYERKTISLQATVVDNDLDRNKKRFIKVPRIVEVVGDGLIIATKSGSTGYCLNAGGPALLEDGFAVVASNGYFKPGFLPTNAKAFVVSCNTCFEVTVLPGGSNLPCVVADSDSERTRLLKEGERVIIKRSPKSNLFLEF